MLSSILRRALAVTIAATPIAGQEAVPAGHSAHGEAFDEGPRQAAYLMPNSGVVRFPISTDDPNAQAMFDQGIGQLHGFWYFEAERSFRQVAALEPDCSVAFWGMAMANRQNERRAAAFAHEAWRRRRLGTERERRYAESIARLYGVDRDEFDASHDVELTRTRRRGFLDDLEAIVAEYPEDLEAKAFLVNQYWHYKRDRNVSKAEREKLVQEILTEEPEHPANHYRIHLWDQDSTIDRVVDSAWKAGPSWPTVAHQWHMGGHVFDRLERYGEAAWHQEASARVDHAHMMRDLVLPDRIHNFAHNNEWLVRSLRSAGRMRDAIALAKNMIELPRHPRWNGPDVDDCSSSFGPKRLLETLEAFERWEELVEPGTTRYLGPPLDEVAQVKRAYLLGKAHVFLGRDSGADEALAVLDDAAENARSSRARSTAKDRRAILWALADVLAGRDVDAALELLDDEDLDDLTLARLHADAGQADRAEKLARRVVRRDEGRALPRATLAYVLERAGQHAEALDAFRELRAMSSGFDLEAPAFRRLAPLARAAGLPEDWRVAYASPSDAGVRVSLDELGPLHWSPPPAPGWTAIDADGGRYSSEETSGAARILILFLGLGCGHCVEQLEAFAPMAVAFSDASIELIAIGDDPPDALAEIEGECPFPVLSDVERSVFRAYRSYDDFEDVPLHGTFLLDAQDRIRWMDVGPDPFTDAEFLLDEAQRLLGFDHGLGSR